MSDFGGWTTPDAQVSYFKPADRENHLIGILSVKVIEDIFDTMRDDTVKRAICEIVDFDGDGVIETNVSIQHPAIVRKLSVGGPKVLGRLKKTKTKSGYMAWILDTPNDDDLVKASKWSVDAGLSDNSDGVDAAADALRKLGA